MDDYFETKIVNHRPALFALYESNGQVLERISEKGWTIIVSENSRTTYARWDLVEVFGDHVYLRERPGWREPERGEFVTELLNVDGEEVESRIVNGSVVFLPRHIPVTVEPELTDELIYYSRLEIKKVWERQRSDKYGGYFCRVPFLRDIRTQRPKAQIEKALMQMGDRDLEPPPLVAATAEEPEVLFATIFENKTDQARLVLADNGMKFFTVGAGEKVLLESHTPEAMYSRFKTVTFKKNGAVELDKNSKWKNPWPLSVELINEDGASIEGVFLGGQHVNVIKGIPRYAEVRLDEDAALYKSFTWKRIKVKKTRPTLPGYFEETEEIHIIKEPRSEKELKELRRQRAEVIGRKADAAKAKIMEGK